MIKRILVEITDFKRKIQALAEFVAVIFAKQEIYIE